MVIADRHAGRPRDSAADADPEGPLPVPRTGRPRPHVRLPRRARRIAAVSAAAGAANWAWSAAPCCSAWSTPAVALWSTFLFRDHLPRRGLDCAPPASLVLLALCGGMAGADRITDTADDNLYADEVILARRHALPAHRPHPVEGRHPPVPQLAPAVQLARRVPLSRGAGASGTRRRCRRRAACWCCGGGDGLAVREILKYPPGRDDHAGRPRSGDDPAVLARIRCSSSSTRTR